MPQILQETINKIARPSYGSETSKSIHPKKDAYMDPEEVQANDG